MDHVDGFMQAKNFSWGRGGMAPSLWVIHDEEYPERVDAAWDVARFFARDNAPQASAHACVDNRNAIGCVDWDDTAWHSGHGGTNQRSIGVEHSGYASQSREEWLDEYGISMMNRSAQLFADVGHGMFGIPARWLNPAEVAAGQSGICGHADVTYGYGIYGGHTDPGVNFPKDYFVDLCKKYIGEENPDTEEEMKSIMVLDPDSKTGEVWECWGLWRKHITSEADRDAKRFFGVEYFGADTPEAFRRLAIRTTKNVAS